MTNTQIDELTSLMFGVSRMIREQTAGKGGLDAVSLVQIKILAFVLEKKNPTMNEVAKSLLITAPSATSAITSLVKSGQLKRINDSKDRRIVRLNITSKGEKSFAKCRNNAVKIIEKMLEKLDQKEKKAFADTLRKIINSQNK